MDTQGARARLGEMALYLAAKFVGQPGRDTLGRTKLLKLLYFSDFTAYRELGHPISGVKYKHLPFGPVPACFEDMEVDLIRADAATVEVEYSGDYERSVLKPKRSAFDGQFDKNELVVMDEVVKRFRHWSAKKLSDYSHNERGYLMTQLGEEISYTTALMEEDGVTDDDLRWARENIGQYSGSHDPDAEWARALQPEELTEAQAKVIDAIMAGLGSSKPTSGSPVIRGHSLARIRP